MDAAQAIKETHDARQRTLINKPTGSRTRDRAKADHFCRFAAVASPTSWSPHDSERSCARIPDGDDQRVTSVKFFLDKKVHTFKV